MKKKAQTRVQEKKKRPYQRPMLVVEGSIEQATQASGSPGGGDALFITQSRVS